MAVKTPFSQNDFEGILARYDLGGFARKKAVRQGTVQTNYFVDTTQGKFVLRYYENRSKESVLFETELLTHLTAHQYPCPAPLMDRQGGCVGTHQGKPFVVFEFIAGQHVEHPSERQWQQLAEKAAELQKLTAGFYSSYTPYRLNYDPGQCSALAHAAAVKIDTRDAYEKQAWLTRELSTLQLPQSLPKTICHCDFHFSNVLFRKGRFAALIDFDDANRTYAQFDLVGLMEYWAWPNDADLLDLERARIMVQQYSQHRPLVFLEQKHLFDVYKLSILIDCVWYFSRGRADDFREKRKIDALTNLGRQRFFDEIFREPSNLR